MTFDDLRAIALTWPGVEIGTSYGTPALKARQKLIARLWEDGTTIVLLGVDFDQREILIAAEPAVFFFTEHYRAYPIVLARLPNATAEMIEPILRRRWQKLMPKKR